LVLGPQVFVEKRDELVNVNVGCLRHTVLLPGTGTGYTIKIRLK
jgi:hypothetical protein